MTTISNNVFEKMDDEYGNDMEKLFGPTLLGFPEGVDSSRLYMFTSNLKQILNMLNPDVPHIQTGYENVVGERNKAFLKLEGTWKVCDIIEKFGDHHIYTIVLYNKKTDTYEMIEKVVAEDLTEKFGYVYNTSRMDSLKVGQTFTDEVIYKTTSYDQHMNYRTGKNANVMYCTDNSTIEDSIKIRRGWADKVKTVEVDTVQVAINDNDVLLNLYGDDDTYKTFPDIGEVVEGCSICAVRRINLNHILYDFQIENMRKVYSTDTEFVVSKGSVIYDINIYYNNDADFPDNIFYSQLKGYYDKICIYADKVTKWCKTIKNSGSKYTSNVTYLKSKYQHYNDKEYKWKHRDRVFSNLLVEFKTLTVVSLQEGFKLVGRYGDKGIISSISEHRLASEMVNNTMESILDTFGRSAEATDEERNKMALDAEFIDDCDMPYLEDGTPVDILLNASGAFRRLNTDQLYEVEINFIAENIQKYICTLKTKEEKIEIIFKFLGMLNENQRDFFLKIYEGYDKTIIVDGHRLRLLNESAQNRFIEDVEKNGFYIIKSPSSCIRYTCIKKIYEEFDWIKPQKAYIDIFGLKKKEIMRPVIIGSKYMFVLKQTSNKNFSARSTGRIDKKGLPARSNDKKTNLSVFSTTPIQIGEAHNMFAAISGRLFAEYNIFMRSSPIGRKSLKRILSAEGDPLAIKKLRVQETYKNVNGLILNAYLKTIGLRLNFITNDESKIITVDTIQPLSIGKYLVYDRPKMRIIYENLFKRFKEVRNSVLFIEEYHGQADQLAWNQVFMMEDIKEYELDDSMRGILASVTSGEDVLPEISPDKTFANIYGDNSVYDRIMINTENEEKEMGEDNEH